jgi:uncharacterized RDD family membrane protein YckC
MFSASYKNKYHFSRIDALLLAARRAGAFLLDILFIFMVAGPLGFFIQRLISDPPQTGMGIWINILWSFSLPTWLYFSLSDRSKTGRTIGKRIFKLQVIGQRKERLGWELALVRTAIKLLPWEIIHFSVFALSKDLGQLSPIQLIGLSIGNGLAFVYFIVTLLTHGRRSVHDLLLKTEVRLFDPKG